MLRGECTRRAMRSLSSVISPEPRPATGWYPELDVMKAAAIVAVVLIHSIRPFWVPDVPLAERLIGQITRFAVPTFLAVSGFLYYRADPIPLRTIGRRLRRILVPYLCVSLAASVYNWVYLGHASTRTFLTGLLLGSTFGPYYYVFLLTQFVCATWLLSRLPAALVVGVFVLAMGSTCLAEMQLWMPLDLFWGARSPHLWAAWFLLGWVAAARRAVLLAFIGRYRGRLLVLWALVLAAWVGLACAGLLTGRSARAAELMLIAANIVGLFGVGRGVRRVPRSVSLVSDWTYALYLLHPFFVYTVLDRVCPALHLSPGWCVPCAWAIGLAGALTATALARLLLGEYSRDVVGA